MRQESALISYKWEKYEEKKKKKEQFWCAVCMCGVIVSFLTVAFFRF